MNAINSISNATNPNKPTVAKNRTNRGIQSDYAFYKNDKEIIKGINLMKPFLDEKAIEILRYFIPTNGSTQIKVKNFCKKKKMSSKTFYKKMKLINTVFGEPIIHTAEAPQKTDSLGRGNKSSEFKFLTPLWKVALLVQKKKKEKEQEQAEHRLQIRALFKKENHMENHVENHVKIETPTESKVEPSFSEQQYKSFREVLLEKDLNNNSIKENDFVKKPIKKFGIKKPIKTFLRNNAFFNAFDDIKQHEIEKRVQLAFIKRGIDVNDIEAQEAILEALRSFVVTYEKQPENVKKDYYGALYVCLENALFDYLIAQEIQEIEEEEMDAQEATGTTQNNFEGYYNQEEENGENEPINGTEKEYEEAFCYGNSLVEHDPFDMFEKELNQDGDWIAPLPPLSDKDELKYYDSIIAQEPQEEPLEALNEVCV